MSKYLARYRIEEAARERHLENQVLAEADRLGDNAPEQLRETAADIREHHTARAARAEHRHRETNPDARETGGQRGHGRAAERDAVAATETTLTHGEPHAQRYAQHLLARYHTLRQLPTVHDQGAADPDRLHDVIQEMCRLADSQRHHLHQTSATTAAQLAARSALDRLAAHHRGDQVDELPAVEHHQAATDESEQTHDR